MVEVDLGDLEEEVGGNSRRRFGRLAKSQVRYKKKANRFWVEEEEEDNSKNSGRELGEENNSDSKRERVNEEKDKSENFVKNTWESFDTVKAHEATHVLASFTLQSITF